MEIKWNGPEAERLVLEGIRAGVEKSAIDLNRHIVENKLSGQVLDVLTGALRQSIASEVVSDADGSSARVGTNLPYAPVHEFGATITPTNAKALTIPLEGAKTGAGAIKGEFSKGVKGMPGVEMIARKGKPPLLVRKKGRGKSQRFELLFVLLRAVTIPARPFMRPAFDEKRQEIGRTIAEEVRRRFAS